MHTLRCNFTPTAHEVENQIILTIYGITVKKKKESIPEGIRIFALAGRRRT